MTPPHVRRRTVLGTAAATGLLGVPASPTFAAAGRGHVFRHGVASGDPLPHAVLIWTRVTPTAASTPGSGQGPKVDVAWEVATDGRFRGTKAVRGASVPTDSSPPSSSPVTWDAVTAALPFAELGERATLLQFSSAFCAPCRVTRQVLTDVAGLVPGVVHVEVDAEHHLELVRELGILRTPTTLILDATGAEATRAMGAPRREAVLATLDGIV